MEYLVYGVNSGQCMFQASILFLQFSQKNSLCKTEVFNNPSDYLACVLNPKHEISQIIPVSQHVLRVSYRLVNDYIRENDTSNIIVSLFTTSIARLKLLSYLQMVERVPGTAICYVDTDSVGLKIIKPIWYVFR